jgi:hypothetical protein
MNAEAKATQAWKESCPDLFDVTTLGDKHPAEYLANRLESAFHDGMFAGRQIERAEIEARLLAAVRGE